MDQSGVVRGRPGGIAHVDVTCTPLAAEPTQDRGEIVQTPVGGSARRLGEVCTRTPILATVAIPSYTSR